MPSAGSCSAPPTVTAVGYFLTAPCSQKSRHVCTHTHTRTLTCACVHTLTCTLMLTCMGHALRQVPVDSHVLALQTAASHGLRGLTACSVSPHNSHEHLSQPKTSLSSQLRLSWGMFSCFEVLLPRRLLQGSHSLIFCTDKLLAQIHANLLSHRQ